MTSLPNRRRGDGGCRLPPRLVVVGLMLAVVARVFVSVVSAFGSARLQQPQPRSPKSSFVTGTGSSSFLPPPASSGTRHAWRVRATPPTSTAEEGTSETTSTGTSADTGAGTATADGGAKNGEVAREPQRRALGSQELLMLPRQYRPDPNKKKEDEVTFPQMTHVSVVTLSATPSMPHLRMAIDEAMASHPLLRSRVEGTGEPERRIDLFKMVREGEPDPLTFVECDDFGSDDVLKVKTMSSALAGDKRRRLYESWRPSFGDDLDMGHFDVHGGPLWSLELHRFGDSESEDGASDDPCALLFTFNHAISDQSSANLLADHILSDLATLDSGESTVSPTAVRNEMPRSLEEAVLGPGETWSDVGPGGLSAGTLKYVAGKAAEGLASPVMLPDDFNANGGGGVLGALSTISGRAAGGKSSTYEDRRSALEFRSLSKESTEALLRRCRENDVTVSNALTAAVALTSSDFIGGSGGGDGDAGEDEAPSGKVKKRNYKVLQSLDKRRFGRAPDPLETVGCHAGSMDLMLGPVADGSGGAIRAFNATSEGKGGGDGGGGKAGVGQFWELARESRDQTKSFVESDGPTHAVRVFDFAMTQTDLNNLVHLTAQSESSQGRAYSAGVTNVGVFERQRAVRRQKGGGGAEKQRSNLKTKHGRYQIEDIYFATPHARSGCLYQVSCMTVNGEAKFTFHPVSPLVSDETAGRFADAFVDLLEVAAASADGGKGFALPDNALSIAAALGGAAGIAVHSEAWSTFFDNVAVMRDNVADPNDFWAAINFWIFFAVGHPILQPILWISDVLHGTPGPMVGDLVPLAFLLGNLAVVAAITLSKELRNGLNIAALSAFITYVGAGLDGKAGLGDYNLQLDDDYKGQVVKGCPAYEDVRQPSMNNFDLEKYQGKWYEQKFHDWTQFKEVYDTSLDIKLTSDGKGWTDDFAVKGPAPKAAKLSWDKSPVANGAHYFLFGRIDDRDPPGVLRESGFGVEFPNYIVDVKKDPETGEYTEAIQFQCLERGGVRVFEGINFMSRTPEMTEEQLLAMHQRAERAGMNPYGAAEEQMHQVERRPVGSPDVDNAWQAMWRSIGVDKLLELLTESIEDGGR